MPALHGGGDRWDDLWPGIFLGHVNVGFLLPNGSKQHGPAAWLVSRVAQYTGVGPCIRFNTVCFVLCVLIRGVLLPGGEGGGVPTATGVPSEYNSIWYMQLAYELA